MEQFSRTTFWTWDSRCDGTLWPLWLWLCMLGMVTVADRTSGITKILFSCHCCLISNARTDICVAFLCLWFVDCELMETLCQCMQLPYLYYSYYYCYVATINEKNLTGLLQCRSKWPAFPQWPLYRSHHMTSCDVTVNKQFT